MSDLLWCLLFVAIAWVPAGALCLALADDDGRLMEWYDEAPRGWAWLCHAIFWLLWPAIIARYRGWL